MISIQFSLLLVAELVVNWLPLTCQPAVHYFIRASMEASGSPVTVQAVTPDQVKNWYQAMIILWENIKGCVLRLHLFQVIYMTAVA